MAKKYEELTFADDFMFTKILEQNPELCREMLELILARKLGNLACINREKPIEITADGRGVRFDIYAEEDHGTVYDVEMQNAIIDSLPKRSRYAQSMIDLNLIERGAKYQELNQTYVIFICNFNLFPRIGRHKYSFASLCREDCSIELGDEAEKVFLCAEGTQDDISGEMKAFLKYVAEGTPESAFTQEIEKAVTDARLHKKWRQEYMTLLEHYEREREEGRKEGREEGREEERKNTLRERERAEAAEQRVKELEQLLAQKEG